MASLIKILAASVGGGIVLGAGIRLGEAIATQLPVPGGEAGDRLVRKLDEIEHRLTSLETEDISAPPIPAAAPEPVREELRVWLEESVSVRMAEVETRLRAENERGQKQILDAFADSVESRVIQRISRLEDEVANQSAAMSELRECSLRTESSVHKLLGGLDKLIPKNLPSSPEEPAATAQANPPEAQPEPASDANSGPETAPASEVPLALDPPRTFTPPAKRRRWGLFR